MHFISDFWWLWLVAFLVSGAYIVRARRKAKDEVQAQFVVMGCVMAIFYCVCFLSGICTILNFLWRWVL
jgi:hypothetical protein